MSDPTAGDNKIVGLHGATVMQQALPLGIDEWGLSRALRSVSLSSVWKVYPEDDPSHPAQPNEAQPNENAMPGLAPTAAPGLDPVELIVDGETFVVTRRAGSSGTYDFAWTSHPASYGFTIGGNADWHPDRAGLAEQIRSFLADIDPKTGYLRD